MTPSDRAAFLEAIAGLDSSIDFVTIEAGKNDDTYDTQTAPLVGQIGNAAKAVLLLTNLILELNQPAPATQPLAQCVLCPRPATRLAGDWEVCDTCYEGITTPDPASDETWGELLADVIGGM